MKRIYPLWKSLLPLCFLFYQCSSPKTASPEKPQLHGLEKEEKERDLNLEALKNRKWSAAEAEQHLQNMQLVANSIAEYKAEAHKTNKTTVDVSSLGTWKCRGPYNMPGAFEFCEADEGTDTVYAVNCGHYGGVQFIWKGLLSGDNWTLISPKHPSRFEDLVVVPNAGKRRVIAAHEKGKVMYSDDGGKNWVYSTGLPSSVWSTIVNRQDNHVLYSTDGKNVYRSTDKGASFSSFFSTGFSNPKNARLYSPRWNNQPNAMDVYLAVDNKFYKLNAAKTSFDVLSSSIPSGSRIGIGGDSRKLWLTVGKKWHYSTNGGSTFTYQLTKDWYYDAESNDLNPTHCPAVNPENPDIFIGGATHPITTRDAGVTQNNDAKEFWGYYQNAVGNDNKVRINYHPDIQSSHFFYDKNGKLYSLRVTDGGVFRSYNEWTFSSFPNITSIQNNVFYNISLLDKPSQETYDGAFMYGYASIGHLTVGTQDQGWQNTRSTAPVNNMYWWDQVGGGDGPCCITGDGKIGWSYDYFGTKDFKRIQLYNGTTYKGLSGAASAATDFTFTGGHYFTPAVGDWSNGNRIWVLSRTLRRIEYNTSTAQITALEKNLSNTSDYIQGFAQSRKNPATLYAMQKGIVFKSTDTGTNWTQKASASITGMSAASENSGMGWSSPLDENIVLFAAESGTGVKSIFSKDGGNTWINVTGSGANLFPPAKVNGMAGTADGKMVFASTSFGPYVFIVNEEKWYPLAVNDDVPLFWGHIVYCVKYGNQEVVRFSTWGQGVWDFELDGTTGIKEALAAEKLDLYPNPATDVVNVHCPYSPEGASFIWVYDAQGKLVLSSPHQKAETMLQVDFLKPGVYTLIITGGYKTNLHKKFIKT